jgi:hypothetical protein
MLFTQRSKENKMSLDVSLTSKEYQKVGQSGIYIRENGRIKEITREKWDQSYPRQAPCIVGDEAEEELFSANITHNLGRMAQEAGIYQCLWRPDEINIKKAKELIEPLALGLAMLHGDPKFFRKFNPENGWGTYEVLVEFVHEYLAACIRYPDSDVRVSR